MQALRKVGRVLGIVELYCKFRCLRELRCSSYRLHMFLFQYYQIMIRISVHYFVLFLPAINPHGSHTHPLTDYENHKDMVPVARRNGLGIQ